MFGTGYYKLGISIPLWFFWCSVCFKFICHWKHIVVHGPVYSVRQFLLESKRSWFDSSPNRPGHQHFLKAPQLLADCSQGWTLFWPRARPVCGQWGPGCWPQSARPGLHPPGNMTLGLHIRLSHSHPRRCWAGTIGPRVWFPLSLRFFLMSPALPPNPRLLQREGEIRGRILRLVAWGMLTAGSRQPLTVGAPLKEGQGFPVGDFPLSLLHGFPALRCPAVSACGYRRLASGNR